MVWQGVLPCRSGAGMLLLASSAVGYRESRDAQQGRCEGGRGSPGVQGTPFGFLPLSLHLVSTLMSHLPSLSLCFPCAPGLAPYEEQPGKLAAGPGQQKGPPGGP